MCRRLSRQRLLLLTASALLLTTAACAVAPSAAAPPPETPTVVLTPEVSPTPEVTPTSLAAESSSTRLASPEPPAELNALDAPGAVEPSITPALPISQLQDTLSALYARNRAAGEYAFAVTDLQTGETVGVNLLTPHYTGCTISFFALLQATIDVQHGRLEEGPVGDLISRTVYSSSALAARDLYALVGSIAPERDWTSEQYREDASDVVSGVERVAALIDHLALEDTILDHPPLFATESRGVNANNWITVADMNSALSTLWSGDLLTEEWRDFLLDKMTGVKPGLNYLTAVGPTVPVSHKNGFFPTDAGWYVDNDIGVVRFDRDGQQLAYAISIYSQRVPHKYDDVFLGQAVSSAAWSFFQQRYPTSEVSAAAEDPN